MKTLTLTLAFLLTMSLVFITHANERRVSNALREQLLDYLLEARREELLNNQRKEYEKQVEQYRENLSKNDESDDSDDYEKTNVRRKAVGLGDNPYK